MPGDVILAIPAHDEQDTIEACLASVLTAVRRAQRAGLVRQAHIAVAAHRCSDTTSQRAAAILARHHQIRASVVADSTSTTVGQVRHAIISRTLASQQVWAPNAWVFSTDADSVVPDDWVVATLEQALEVAAAAVVGLVTLSGWVAPARARRAYDEIIADGLQANGHGHVYAANLAVRLDAYLDVGGFPSVKVGEDDALVRRLRAQRWPVLAATSPLVQTSSRFPGRAAGGLGDLLGTLVNDRYRPRGSVASGPDGTHVRTIQRLRPRVPQDVGDLGAGVLLEQVVDGGQDLGWCPARRGSAGAR